YCPMANTPRNWLPAAARPSTTPSPQLCRTWKTGSEPPPADPPAPGGPLQAADLLTDGITLIRYPVRERAIGAPRTPGPAPGPPPERGPPAGESPARRPAITTAPPPIPAVR